MEKIIDNELKHLFPVFMPEHEEAIQSAITQIKKEPLTYIIPMNGLNAKQRAETAVRQIELNEGHQSYILRPHLALEYDDYETKIIQPIKDIIEKSKTKPLFIIEADYTNQLVVMPLVIVLSEEIVQLGGQTVISGTKEELDLMADYAKAMFTIAKSKEQGDTEEWKQKQWSQPSITVFSSKT